MLPGLDMYRTNPAQHIITASKDLDDLSVDDLSDGCRLYHRFRYAAS